MKEPVIGKTLPVCPILSMEKGEDRLFTLEVIIRKENDKLKQPYQRLTSGGLEEPNLFAYEYTTAIRIISKGKGEGFLI